MDSLLDALTNVVGILVIVLVAVQISSQEAAKRMEEMIEKIDPEEQKKIEQEAQEAKAQIEQVTQAIAQEKNQEKIDPEKLLKALKDDIEAAEKKAQADRLAAIDVEKAAEKARLEAEKAKELLAIKLVALKKKAEELTASKDDLTVKLKKTPRAIAPRGLSVRPPTPGTGLGMYDQRSGKKLLSKRQVLVTGGRAIPWFDEGGALRKTVEAGLAQVAASLNLPFNAENRVSDKATAEKVVKAFNSLPLTKRELPWFVVSLKLAGSNFRVSCALKEGAGETPEEAMRGNFSKTFRNKQRDWYLQYLVTPDSYEEYNLFRSMSDRSGFLAGWTPIDEKPEHLFEFGTKFNYGPKPPPRPNTPPPPRKPKEIASDVD